MKIKICGMREPDNIRQVTNLHPDYMGFIFWSGSPRNACQLDPAALATVPQTIRRVGVFVNETEEQVIRTAQRYRLDLVQLHGHESPEACRRINQIVPVIKALSVATRADIEQTQRYQECCSILLLDTKTSTYGGSGQQFDWSLLEHYTGRLPFLLSGGIGPQDAERLLSLSHHALLGFYLNRRFESAPGHKEYDRLKPCIEQFKKQNHE